MSHLYKIVAFLFKENRNLRYLHSDKKKQSSLAPLKLNLALPDGVWSSPHAQTKILPFIL
jgi:hypothetical protein